MSCDSVCIGVDVGDYEPSEFYRDGIYKARKEHKCCECDGKILPGVRYFKTVGKWEGKFSTFRQCLPCHEIQRAFSCDGGWVYGGLWEAWDDADGFASLTVHDSCFKKLSLEAREFLVQRWWRWKEDHPYEQ